MVTITANISEYVVEGYKQCLLQYTDEELDIELKYQIHHAIELEVLIEEADVYGQHRRDLSLSLQYMAAIKEEQERRFIA